MLKFLLPCANASFFFLSYIVSPEDSIYFL